MAVHYSNLSPLSSFLFPHSMAQFSAVDAFVKDGPGTLPYPRRGHPTYGRAVFLEGDGFPEGSLPQE
jgi:hypothetical protein